LVNHVKLYNKQPTNIEDLQ